MSEITTTLKYAKMSDIMCVVMPILEDRSSVRLCVTGWSMYPFLRGSTDSVVLGAPDIEQVKKCDIVLFKRNNGQFVLHRISKVKQANIYFTGDAQTTFEGPINKSQIIAVVTSIYRVDKQISCKSCSWRFMSWIWLLFRPFRPTIINVYKRIRSFIG